MQTGCSPWKRSKGIWLLHLRDSKHGTRLPLFSSEKHNILEQVCIDMESLADCILPFVLVSCLSHTDWGDNCKMASHGIWWWFCWILGPPGGIRRRRRAKPPASYHQQGFKSRIQASTTAWTCRVFMKWPLAHESISNRFRVSDAYHAAAELDLMTGWTWTLPSRDLEKQIAFSLATGDRSAHLSDTKACSKAWWPKTNLNMTTKLLLGFFAYFAW